jgi:transcriptional regulator EpsA
MSFLPSLSTEDLHHYHRVVTHSVEVRSHFDMLIWLQGDMQKYLPHDILIAAWGDFATGPVQHDIISAMSGVRSHAAQAESVSPLMMSLFKRWAEFGKKPFSLNAGQTGFSLDDLGLKSALGGALLKMRSATVHGISDERGSHDCVYVVFSAQQQYTDRERNAMAMVMPYIDTALRQVEHLPHQAGTTTPPPAQTTAETKLPEPDVLTERESEILKWVALGKTNPEIGSILDISAFTVKNHMQRVFKKLDVSNRAQAVGKFRAWVNHV